MSSSIEDNTFDFKVKDRLMEECKDETFYGPMFLADPHRNQLIIDMIAYCSQGNPEDAVLNLKTTLRFKKELEAVQRNLSANTFYYRYRVRGALFIHEFWKKCFIQIKLAVQKQESPPREPWHIVIVREYGRFLISGNFTHLDAFEAEVRLAFDSLKTACNHFNDAYKAMVASDG